MRWDDGDGGSQLTLSSVTTPRGIGVGVAESAEVASLSSAIGRSTRDVPRDGERSMWLALLLLAIKRWRGMRERERMQNVLICLFDPPIAQNKRQ